MGNLLSFSDDRKSAWHPAATGGIDDGAC